MKHLLTAILLFICMSCTVTRVKEVPIETVKTEYVAQTRYDSIYIHDSIDRLIKGDTVYIHDKRNVFRYKYLHDTICVTDTIQKPVYIETVREVNKVSGYQSFFMYLGIAFLAFLGYRIYKKIRKLLGK